MDHPRWPHQVYAVDETTAAIDRGERRICVTSPTGGGKTTVMLDLAEEWLSRGQKVALYSNRRSLVDQTSRVAAAAGFSHGLRMSGEAPDLDERFQIASIQTEHSRVKKYGAWHLHDAQLVLVDEAHLHANPLAQKILGEHHAQGAAIVGFTATPLGLGGVYETLIQAGTVSELRKCGALVPCHHYGPDEPDLKQIGRVTLGEDLSEKQIVKAIMREGIFGRVLEAFRQINPGQLPTILFAPGVAESVWFAEQFNAAGISAAHIDGEEVIVNGQTRQSDRRARSAVLDGSRRGDIVVLCNRFVLREGIDAPWLAHGIFATVFGSLQSYLQSGGRLLRAHPSLDHVTLQDHGGNWWRHGSLNEDRQWQLEYTAPMIAGLRDDRLRQRDPGDRGPKEPARCPQCSRILFGTRCPCGYDLSGTKKSRPVIQSDGTLREMRGDIFKPRRICQQPSAVADWVKMYWRSFKARKPRTFKQAFALYAGEHNWGWPDRSWPFMPKRAADAYKLVKDVPMDRLTSNPRSQE